MKKKYAYTVNGQRRYITSDKVHYDELLSQISVKYRPTGLIGDQIAPKVSVKKTHDKYRVYDKNWRIPETERANRARSREHNFDVSTASYVLKRHSLHSPVSDTDKDNYDEASLLADTTEELTDKIAMRHELEVGSLFTTTNWSLNVSLAAGATFSDNTVTSNPIPVFQTGASTVIANSGLKPNFGWLARNGYIAAINHVSVLDRVKYTSAEMDEKKLAALFDLEKGLLIPAAQYDSSEEGTSTAAMTGFFDNDNAFLGWKPDSPGPLKPSSLYTFEKAMPLVKRWREEDRESEIVEVNKEFTVKVVASLSGYLIRNTN
jgi:hypothetical protein